MKKVLTGIIMLSSTFLMANDCIKTRAAFDIGSGTTKLKVAKVDICKQKIIKLLFESNRAIEYKQALKQSQNNTLNSKILTDGIKHLKALKSEASHYNPSSYVAVATSAFRTAANGRNAAQRLSRESGVDIAIISQEKEAKIGFVGASVISDNDLRNIIVWDIGGGSMQMTSYEGNGKYNIYKGKLASVSFKNYLIEKVQKKDIKETISPNPISEDESQKSLRDASVHAKNTIPKSIIDKLRSGNIQVLGIGGVHYYSIGKNVSESKTYSLEMVTNHISEKLNLNDKQLGGGKYVTTDISNLILVAGFMKELEIESVKTGKINMADGLLIKPSLINE
jgi:exopolyphosphatase/guanosine-5'-triphosphate,3'-diphosphate pyrophosphatase